MAKGPSIPVLARVSILGSLNALLGCLALLQLLLVAPELLLHHSYPPVETLGLAAVHSRVDTVDPSSHILPVKLMTLVKVGLDLSFVGAVQVLMVVSELGSVVLPSCSILRSELVTILLEIPCRVCGPSLLHPDPVGCPVLGLGTFCQ